MEHLVLIEEKLKNERYLLFVDELKIFDNPWDILEDQESFKRWLWDKDKLVRKVVDLYCDKKGVMEKEEERDILKDRIEVFFHNVMGDKYSELDEIRDFYKGYSALRSNSGSRKTKKKMEEFQKVSEKLKVLSEEMQIDFGKSFEMIYSINIINVIELNSVENQMICENYLDKYKEINDKIVNDLKDINNKIKIAKKAMDDFVKKIQIKINKLVNTIK